MDSRPDAHGGLDVRAGEQALADVRDALGAADRTVPHGRLYAEVIRPAIAALCQETGAAGIRLAISVGEALLLDFATADAGEGTERPQPSEDRRAAVLFGAGGLRELDASAAAHVLELAGWEVERVRGDGDPSELAAIARGGAVELVVVMVGSPLEMLSLARAFGELRRLPDPPVIVLCDFAPISAAGTASMSDAGADAVAHDPEAVLAAAEQWLPGAGRRRWGVSLRRSDGDLALAPTGQLDEVSVTRIAEVVATRIGTFSRLLLDLSELAVISAPGTAELTRWAAGSPCGEAELVVLADAQARRRLDATGEVLPAGLLSRTT